MEALSKRYDDPVEVEVEVEGGGGPAPTGEAAPVAFLWRGRLYLVEGVLKRWREAGEAWDPAWARDDECFRVEAEGGVYDLRKDRLGKGGRRWRLARVWD